jgi:hypothetical protein
MKSRAISSSRRSLVPAAASARAKFGRTFEGRSPRTSSKALVGMGSVVPGAQSSVLAKPSASWAAHTPGRKRSSTQVLASRA